jgi:hypothetical protein
MKAKILSMAAVAGLLLGSTAIVHAQSRGGMGAGPGTSGVSPGHEMKQPGGSGERSEGGPGASGFSPGHEMQEGEGRGGPSASGLAPGRNKGTTGAGDRDDARTNGFGRDGDDRMRKDSDDRMMDNDRRGVEDD